MLSNGMNSGQQEVGKLLCEACYHELACNRHVDENGRCSFFIKNSNVEIGEGVEFNPMDTITYDYDDWKTHFEDTSKDSDDLPEP